MLLLVVTTLSVVIILIYFLKLHSTHKVLEALRSTLESKQKVCTRFVEVDKDMLGNIGAVVVVHVGSNSVETFGLGRDCLVTGVLRIEGL